MRYFVWCLLLLLPGSHAAACLWDQDTEKDEIDALPGMAQIISGRFPRNPPLYYEIRLRRAAAAIRADPANLAAYDDAAVACDRLHRGNEAIAWMARKRHQLPAAPDPSNKKTYDHYYRYLANMGTFWAHRWLRAGADRGKLDEVRTARTFIQAALLVNPNAHFGREKYQLQALEWLLVPGLAAARSGPLPSFYQGGSSEGLAGLIRLGDAWESVDVLHALSLALNAEGKERLAYLATLRCRELVDKDRRSLHPHAPTDSRALKERVGPGMQRLWAAQFPDVTARYRRLRRETDAWHWWRTRYMMHRLRQGRHPDTDITFWDDYHDEVPLTIAGVPVVWEWATPAIALTGGFATAVLFRRRRAAPPAA